MNRQPSVVLCAVVAVIAFCIGVDRTQAQASQPPAPAQAEAQKDANAADAKDKDKKEEEDEEESLFAPQPAPPLPAGMTGSDVNDPRANLSPGLDNAGETAMGIKHLLLLKKPD